MAAFTAGAYLLTAKTMVGLAEAVEADEAEAEPARPADDHQRTGWQWRNLDSTRNRRRQHHHGLSGVRERRVGYSQLRHQLI